MVGEAPGGKVVYEFVGSSFMIAQKIQEMADSAVMFGLIIAHRSPSLIVMHNHDRHEVFRATVREDTVTDSGTEYKGA